MKFVFQYLVFWLAATISFCGYSHSPAWQDYFEFDDSNGGASVTELMRRAATSDSGVESLCVNRFARGYPCWKIDLQSFLPKASMGAAAVNLNDIWGWTDPMTGSEIAIVGLENGTSFVDITDPVNPVYLGRLPTHRPQSGNARAWRDVKVYDDHAFIVADGDVNRMHGLQIFDLTRLRSIASPPQTLTETAHMGGFGNAHNIAVNEDTGYAYVVGSDSCSGGLFMVNISNPASPRYSGCFSGDGYTHDAQCVVYVGVDRRYRGREICFAYNEDSMTIVDVSDKRNPRELSKTAYQGSQYTHQGWLADSNQSIVILNDELDELIGSAPTTSFIFDVSNLRQPRLLGRHLASTNAIDHNLYSKDGYVFQTNYRAGLRILSSARARAGRLKEVAYFDVVPGSNSAQFSGAWSSYIYFASGNVVVSDIGGGLFVLRPDWAKMPNDSRPLELSIDNIVVTEKNRFARMTINLSRISNEAVTVVVSTRARTAGSADYRPKARRIRFEPGETIKKFTVRMVDDNRVESTERFVVRLTRSTNATVSDGIGNVTIRDDD